MYNTKLKPISHKNNNIPNNIKSINSNSMESKKKNSKKQTQKSQTIKLVKKEEKIKRPSTAIQLYDNDDFQMPALEEDKYFECQIQKNIKTQIMQRTQKTLPKNQIMLPKLQQNTKQMKELEREMDLQMSRILDQEMGE